MSDGVCSGCGVVWCGVWCGVECDVAWSVVWRVERDSEGDLADASKDSGLSLSLLSPVAVGSDGCGVGGTPHQWGGEAVCGRWVL